MKSAFTISILILGSCFLCLFTQAQSGTWIWMNGSNMINDTAIYGMQGEPSVHNGPAACYSPSQWKDNEGNFWVFGGVSTAGESSDLWKYEPDNNTWTWVNGPGIPNIDGVYGTQGVPAASNLPGGRHAGSATWTDSTGDLWLFAGIGFDADGDFGNLNDLWRFHIASNEWTWMGGTSVTGSLGVYGNLQQASPASVPPARIEVNTAWVDSHNNLWLFGGSGYNDLNDMWRYSISSSEWTWMSGSDGGDVPNSYGIPGVESPTNVPGSRSSYTHWTNGDYLYLSGGENFDHAIPYSDVWRFNLNTNYWTWVGGDSGAVANGYYNNYCSDSTHNEPRGRYEQRAVQVGCTPVLFMWAGGFLNRGILYYNDLWTFDLSTSGWIWISGTNVLDAVGNYGTEGISSPSNIPQGVIGDCFWNDEKGNLWTFGGAVFGGYTNAMWEYIPDYSCFTADTTSVNLTYTISAPVICAGDSVLLSFSDDSALSISPGNSVTWIDSLHAELKPDTTTAYTISGYTLCGFFNSQSFTLLVTSDTFKFTANKTVICRGDSVLLNFSGDTGVNISPNTNVTWVDSLHAVLTPDTTSLYTISGYSECGSYSSKAFTLIVNTDTFNFTANKTSVCRGNQALLSFNGDTGLSISPNTNVTWIDSANATLKPDTSTVYTIKGYSSCGTLHTQTFTLLVSDSLNITFTKTSVCYGDSAILSFTNDSALSISPGANVSWIDSLQAVLKPDTNTVFTISGYSACGFIQQLFTLRVINDSVNISSNKQTICSGDTAQICAPAGLSNYNWNTGGTTACISATDAGNYYVSATENGCQATSNHISLNVYPTTTVETNVTGDTLRGFNAVTYQWLLNDVAINGATASIYIAETSGSYTLQITDSFGCIETSNPIVITGLNNIPSQNSITVFPNPTSTGWQLNVGGEWIGSIVEVFDATGRSVFKSTITNQHSMIEIAGLANGVYELRITQQGYNVVRKLVKI